MMDERGWWTTEEETATHVFDIEFAKAIASFVQVNSGTVIDIGCGNGRYVEFLREKGIEVVGYDGSPLTPQISKGICRVADFSVPQDLGLFDVVLSIEVGEHIPQAYEQTFINNVCGHAREWVILTWAVEGQGGTGHVNCKNNNYVIEQVEKRGWELSVHFTEWMRQNCSISWLKNTIMVFKAK